MVITSSRGRFKARATATGEWTSQSGGKDVELPTLPETAQGSHMLTLLRKESAPMAMQRCMHVLSRLKTL